MRAFRLLLSSSVLFFVACGGETPTAEAPPTNMHPGHELYMKYGCALCHGPKGHGDGTSAPMMRVPPRDFHDAAQFHHGSSVEEISETIRAGVDRGRTGMPPFAHIPEDERALIAEWINSLSQTADDRSVTEDVVAVRDAWVRSVPPTSITTAAYLEIANRSSTEISLVGARSRSASSIEIHESVDDGGVGGMRKLDAVAVPPGGTVALRPGGKHLMLIGYQPIDEGAVFLVLQLSDGREIPVQAEVRAE